MVSLGQPRVEHHQQCCLPNAEGGPVLQPSRRTVPERPDSALRVGIEQCAAGDEGAETRLSLD